MAGRVRPPSGEAVPWAAPGGAWHDRPAAWVPFPRAAGGSSRRGGEAPLGTPSVVVSVAASAAVAAIIVVYVMIF